jgi:hypothetical protein
MAIRPPHDKLLEFLAPYRKEITQLALRVREAILKQDPEAIELIYDAYNAVVTAFCAVAVYRDYVNLSFNYGALLPDPKEAPERTRGPASVTSKSKILKN